MHEVVVVQYHRGWRAALFYFVDALAVLLVVFAAWAAYQFYILPASNAPTPAEHITLPESKTVVPVQKI